MKLFEQRFEEEYNVPDPAYLAWKSANHPSPESVSLGTSTVNCTTSSSITSPVSVEDTSSIKSSEVLNDLLTITQPPSTTCSSGRPKKKAVNAKALEITSDDFLQAKEPASAEAKKRKEEKRVERECRGKGEKKEKEKRKRRGEEIQGGKKLKTLYQLVPNIQ